MSGLSVIVADDEPIARRILREEIASIEDLNLIGEAETGPGALELIESLHPDLVFLDLEMPGMGGFDVISRLTSPAPSVVIVTAFDEHAVRAFEAGAIDYLLKPVSRERLLKSLERIARLRTQPVEPPGKVIGRLGDDYVVLDPAEVLAFLAEGDSVWVETIKRRYAATHSLRAIEERTRRMPFERVHRNAIVNVNHVRKMSALSSQRWLLTLTNGFEITVSKRQAQSVRRILNW